MRHIFFSLFFLAFCFLGCQSRPSSGGQQAVSEAEEGKVSGVFFRNIQNGAVLRSPFTVEMGVSGMELEPAGEVREGYGHHHILVNMSHWPIGEVIPMSDSTIHYGQGQSEVTLSLAPGEYTLSLQYADGVHASYGPDWATSVDILVQE